MADLFRTLLLATQCTEFDAGAERVAIALAARRGIPLYAVVPLVSNTEYETFAPLLEDVAEAQAAAGLKRLRETAAARHVTLIGNVRLGEEPYREILAEANERAADLIVARKRGKRGFLASLLIGEMVHAMTRHAPCDVLLVPREADIWSRGILAATDGSPHGRRTTQVAASIAAAFALPLTLVSVATDEDPDGRIATDHVNAAALAARAAGASVQEQMLTGKASEAILRAATQAGADLVVLGRRGSNPVKRTLLGGTSEWVASHTDCPVLIVRADD
ncbi:MAG TPA: universal stress protein [Burkholderiaceae bacterium]|nr:universal stress protein [Burkholderiaceae bacterium]